MDHFIEFIAKIIPGETAALDLLKPYIKVKAFSKNDFILTADTVSDRASFISKGACYMYRSVGGKEEVTEFYFERALTGDYVSFIEKKPSDHYIKALEDTIIEELSHKDLNELYKISPPIERAGRILSERTYCRVITRMLSYQNDTPEQRYQQLLEERPALFQRVPQYLIASYLGVTPVGLSKIRKRINNNERPFIKQV